MLKDFFPKPQGQNKNEISTAHGVRKREETSSPDREMQEERKQVSS